MTPIARLVAVAVALLSFAATGPAVAQGFSPVGHWSCTVNAASNDPAGNYGLEVEMQVAPDGSLFARGMVIYGQLQNPIRHVQGYGDWILLPPDQPGGSVLYKFRMHPPNHAIISWFVRPVGPGQMYNLFQPPPVNGLMRRVETQCGRLG